MDIGTRYIGVAPHRSLFGPSDNARYHMLDESNRKEQMTTIPDGMFVLLSLLLG